MTEQEKATAERLLQLVDKLPQDKQDHVLGYAEGYAEGYAGGVKDAGNILAEAESAALIAATREQNGEASHD